MIIKIYTWVNSLKILKITYELVVGHYRTEHFRYASKHTHTHTHKLLRLNRNLLRYIAISLNAKNCD